MSLSRNEADAQYASEYLEELRKTDRVILEDKIRNSFEVEKIRKLSAECKRFLNSNVGRYIQNEAAEQSEGAKDKLAAIKLRDYSSKDEYLDEIKELQFEAHLPALVVTWLYRAIQKAEEEAELFYEE